MASISKTEHQAIAQRREKGKKIALFAVVLGGVVLLIGSVLMLRTGIGGGTSFEYTDQDIAYDLPFVAVHEMEAGPPIPFLPSGGPQPEIAVNEDFYDFGSVGPTEVATRTFVVANLGEAPLTISRAFTTCGCTTAEFTSAVIPPGRVSVITLRFDAGYHDTSGQTVRRGIIIENNDPDRPSIEIWVQASVRSST